MNSDGTTLESDDGYNKALLAALPPRANILELGCATGLLGHRYKRDHVSARWTGVDLNAAALSQAQHRLDYVIALDLDVQSVTAAGNAFDLVVIGDVLEHLKRPEVLLTDLHNACTPDAELVCCIPNMSHTSVIERLIFGDIMYDENGLLDKTHLRFLSPRSTFKMLLDCGWLPNAAGGYQGRHGNERFAQHLIEAAAALGIPSQAAELNMNTYQLVIRSKRRAEIPAVARRDALTVVVPVSNESQLALNLLRSPGLQEIGANMLVFRGAASAAAAFAEARQRATSDWVMLCSQDMYFPRGSGFEIMAFLSTVSPADAERSVVGFAGVGVSEDSQLLRAGLSVEGRGLFDFPATNAAISMADYAVILHRNSALTIDPTLGWDAWATDLCLQSIHTDGVGLSRVCRVPVFHNTTGNGAVSGGYIESMTKLLQKYPHLTNIATLNGNLSRTHGLQPASFANA